MAVSFIGEGNRRTQRKPPTCHKSLTNFITECCTSPWSRFEPTTSVVIGTDCKGSCKSNYHTITAMTAHDSLVIVLLCHFCRGKSLYNLPLETSSTLLISIIKIKYCFFGLSRSGLAPILGMETLQVLKSGGWNSWNVPSMAILSGISSSNELHDWKIWKMMS